MIWLPDTCPCIVELDESLELREVIQACNEHKGFPDSTLLATIQAHNQSFGDLGTSDSEDPLFAEGLQKRRDEKQRILDEGDSDVRNTIKWRYPKKEAVDEELVDELADPPEEEEDV